MAYEPAILIKVDQQTKKEMKAVGINWSEEIRTFIKSRIKKEKNVALAVMLTDKIFNSRPKSNTDEATEIIRKFRDERYGPNSR